MKVFGGDSRTLTKLSIFDFETYFNSHPTVSEAYVLQNPKDSQSFASTEATNN